MAKKFSQDTCLSNVIDLTYEESQSLLSDGKLKSKTENCNVLEILQNDTQGLIVLNNYKSVKTLSHSLRKKMVDVLVNFCIKTYGRKSIMYHHVKTGKVQKYQVEKFQISTETLYAF
ncbi:hypothetical protein JTE90_028977 [Oedothorax gibbosus]|uniref:Uncharacterized protein n=1 Tax=Oedothorax gibbosus TaxID=931172 RepID=A0AAV6VJB9_9ARAC|nr:hypothetical protein JTE90_028977 [Oedothorax gibbosus]